MGAASPLGPPPICRPSCRCALAESTCKLHLDLWPRNELFPSPPPYARLVHQPSTTLQRPPLSSSTISQDPVRYLETHTVNSPTTTVKMVSSNDDADDCPRPASSLCLRRMGKNIARMCGDNSAMNPNQSLRSTRSTTTAEKYTIHKKESWTMILAQCRQSDHRLSCCPRRHCMPAGDADKTCSRPATMLT